MTAYFLKRLLFLICISVIASLSQSAMSGAFINDRGSMMATSMLAGDPLLTVTLILLVYAPAVVLAASFFYASRLFWRTTFSRDLCLLSSFFIVFNVLWLLWFGSTVGFAGTWSIVRLGFFRAFIVLDAIIAVLFSGWLLFVFRSPRRRLPLQ